MLAREPVIAALLGLLMELDGYTVDFAAPDEPPDEAIARLRPPLIICADGALADATSDVFLARAAKKGRVVLFASPELAEEVRALAERRGFPFFELPVDRDTLNRVLEEALAS